MFIGKFYYYVTSDDEDFAPHRDDDVEAMGQGRRIRKPKMKVQ